MLPLLFIDFETTGLDPFVDEIVEVAYLNITHEDAMRGRFDASHVTQVYVMPLNPQRAFLKTNGLSAADINGFSISIWEEMAAVRWIEAVQTLRPAVAQSRWVGHNPCFDYHFYTSLCNRHHIRPEPPGDYHLCDTASMAYNLYAMGLVENLKLDTLASHYKLRRRIGVHSAKQDVLLTARIYRQLCL